MKPIIFFIIVVITLALVEYFLKRNLGLKTNIKPSNKKNKELRKHIKHKCIIPKNNGYCDKHRFKTGEVK